MSRTATIRALWLTALPLLLGCGLAIGVLATPAAGQDEARTGEEPRAVPLHTALSQIRQELNGMLRSGEQWPREAADFATERNWTMETEPLNEVLLRRLDRNPVREGFIKWQLLSFEPDFDRYDKEQWEELYENAPEPLRVPSPTPRQVRGGDYEVNLFHGREVAHVRSFRAVVGDGVVLYRPQVGVITPGGVLALGRTRLPDFNPEGVVYLNRELANSRAHVRNANGPILAYRNALLQNMPTRDGLKAAALVREIRMRFEAHDSSAPDVLTYALEVGPELSEPLTDEQRQTLLQWIDDLAERRLPYTRAFDTDLRGRLAVTTDSLALPSDELQQLRDLVADPSEYRPREPERREARGGDGAAADDVPGDRSRPDDPTQLPDITPTLPAPEAITDPTS